MSLTISYILIKVFWRVGDCFDRREWLCSKILFWFWYLNRIEFAHTGNITFTDLFYTLSKCVYAVWGFQWVLFFVPRLHSHCHHHPPSPPFWILEELKEQILGRPIWLLIKVCVSSRLDMAPLVPSSRTTWNRRLESSYWQFLSHTAPLIYYCKAATI